MARNSEFYKGRRRRKNFAVVPLIILFALLALGAVLFGTMQKYAVITKDGVNVELPLLKSDSQVITDSQGHVVHDFEPVEVEITIDEPDYSVVKQQVSGEMDGVRAIFVSCDELDRDHITTYAGRLNTGNALVLEMKPRSGYLMWNSSSRIAQAYGCYLYSAVNVELPTLIQELKQSDVYLVAQISCLVDGLLPYRSNELALRNEYGGTYSDDTGIWLDPYNTEIREYIAALVGELYDMGFDEVVLADVMHPNIESSETSLIYTAEMTSTPGAVNGVCGFAMYVADAYSDRDKLLSIYVNSAASLVKADTATGQNAPLFFKLYDRVYYNTDRYTYSFNLEDISRSVTVGKNTNRFVPVVLNYLPDRPSEVSWVLIDTETVD